VLVVVDMVREGGRGAPAAADESEVATGSGGWVEGCLSKADRAGKGHWRGVQGPLWGKGGRAS
jgi:hypothetical protein